MTVQERIEAIRRFHEQEGHGEAALWGRQRDDDLAIWKDVLRTINHFVHKVSEDFAARGSPFLFSSVPVETQDSTIFRTKTIEGIRLSAKLQFDLVDGHVAATAIGTDVHLPSSLPLGDVTPEWVELAAERVLIAVLNDRSNEQPQGGAQ
jgi:hypothetical protein